MRQLAWLFKLGRFSVLMGALALSPAAIAGDQDFVLHNETGVEIYALYTSPHGTDDWEEDVLGQDTLEDGQSLEISFSARERARFWDLRVEDSDGNFLVWDKLNLLEISEVTLYYNADNGKAWAEFE